MAWQDQESRVVMPTRRFDNQPLGVNNIVLLMQQLCCLVGLPPRSNHGLRATGPTIAHHAGISDKETMAFTRHESTDGLRSYQR
jgi:hypothetical protein